MDFKIRTIELDGKVVKLQIWDTAGQERFRTITANYFRGAAGVIVVYDITDKNSFDSVPRWLLDVDKFSTDPQQVVRLIVGNKADMEGSRQVPVTYYFFPPVTDHEKQLLLDLCTAYCSLFNTVLIY